MEKDRDSAEGEWRSKNQMYFLLLQSSAFSLQPFPECPGIYI
jgi:hypothetical protein